MITSAQHSRWPSDILIASGDASGLSHASLIRWKIFTLSNDIVIRKAGVLDDRALAISDAALQAMLALPIRSPR